MVDVAALALIVDLDGTVWDSARWFAAALGGEDPAQVERFRLSLLRGTNIVRALDAAGTTRRRLITDATRLLGPPALFPGMREALTGLSVRGVPLGVATSLPGSLAEPMLRAVGIADLFRTVVHAGTCRTAKPHPRSLLMAAALMGVAPGPDVLYVGDRASDAEAATRAGMGFVWMAHGYEQPGPGSGVVAHAAEDLLGL